MSRLKLEGPDAYWRGLSDDGKTAFSIDLKTNALKYHDLATGKVVREVAKGAYHPPRVLSPAINRMGCSDGNLRNAADGKELLEIGQAGWPNPSIMFSADGRLLAAAVVSRRTAKLPVSDPPAEEITVIDAIEGKELRRFGKSVEKFHAIHTAALSRDGKTVVSVADAGDKPDEQLITLWETETGRERGHFLGHRGRTNSLAISADGRFLVSAGEDTTAVVWDATRPQTRNASIVRESPAVDLSAHFKNLAGKDAEQGYASIWRWRTLRRRPLPSS